MFNKLKITFIGILLLYIGTTLTAEEKSQVAEAGIIIIEPVKNISNQMLAYAIEKTDKAKEKAKDFSKKQAVKQTVAGGLRKLSDGLGKAGGIAVDLLFPNTVNPPTPESKAIEDPESQEYKDRIEKENLERQIQKEEQERQKMLQEQSAKEKAERERSEREARDRADGIRAERDRFEREGGNFRAPAGEVEH